MTLRDAIASAAARIPRRDAETLLQHVLGSDRAWILAHPERELTPEQSRALADLAARRAAHEPLQYLTGYQEFFGLDLHVTPDVLIPRPETEVLVQAVLGWAQAHAAATSRDGPLRLLDVGTGSGAIALALAVHLPKAEITAVDVSPAALAAAQANAARLHVARGVRWLQSDLLSAVQPEVAAGLRYDAVVSNPPYVPEQDAPGLQPEVRDFEPHRALFGGSDGLAIYRRLIPEASASLRRGGLLALEIGFGQQASLAALLAAWRDLRFLDDLAGIPRVALAERA